MFVRTTHPRFMAFISGKGGFQEIIIVGVTKFVVADIGNIWPIFSSKNYLCTIQSMR